MNGFGDRVTPSDGAEGGDVNSKELEFSLRPGRCDMLESQEMIIPSESDFSRNTRVREILNGENVNRCVDAVDVTDCPSTSHMLMDDAGVMIQELTVGHYNDANLAVVGTLDNKDTELTRQSQWQHVSQLVGGSGSGSSHTNIVREGAGDMPFPDLLGKGLLRIEQKETIERLTGAENKEAAANVFSHGGIRTKILSKSAFSEFFVKKTLKGKGIICRGPPREVYHAEPMGPTNTKTVDSFMMASSLPPSSCTKTGIPFLHGIPGTMSRPSDNGGVTLREWLKVGNRKVNKRESLYIFRQIVDLVECSHARGVPFHDIRPSCFKLFPSNLVKYDKSPAEKGVLESVLSVLGENASNPENCITRKRPTEQEVCPPMGVLNKKQRLNNNTSIRRWPIFSARSGLKPGAYIDNSSKITDPRDSQNEFAEYNQVVEHGPQYNSRSAQMSNNDERHLTSVSNELEEKWYRSPEELSGRGCTMSSNIYSLGILLFEV